MNKESYIDKYLKDSLKNIISMSVDEEINKKVRKFEAQLIDKRNQYISEIMKGIQIMHQQDPAMNAMTYKIIFENIQRIETSKE